MKTSHIHKYRRVWLDAKKTVPVWRCVVPGCSHYLRKEFLVGRRAMCWACHNEFTIKTTNTYQVRPTCCTRKTGTARELDLSNTVTELSEMQRFFESIQVKE